MFQFDRPRFQNELSSGRLAAAATTRYQEEEEQEDSRLLGVCVSARVLRLEAWVARWWAPSPLSSLRLRSHIVVHHVAVAVDVPVVVVVLGVDERLGDVLL